jgi:hypothetical protein
VRLPFGPLSALLNAADEERKAERRIAMFGLGFAANRITRYTLRKCGVEEKTAKRVGRVVGWTTTALTFDPSGFIDIPDVPDTDVPGYGDDYGDGDTPRRHDGSWW